MQLDIVSLISTVIENSALAAVAILSIYMLNRVWKDRLSAEQKHGEQITCLYEQTLDALQANTKAVTTLTERLEQSK